MSTSPRPIYVYVAGPLNTGELDEAQHVHDTLNAATLVRDLGYYPFVPHLCVLWQIHSPRNREDWLDYDFRWLEKCDVLYRLPGKSQGADAEVAHAEKLGIPVVHDGNALGDVAKMLREEDS